MALTTDTDSVGSDVSPPLAIVPLMDCPLDSTVATIVGTNTGNPADTPPGTAIAIGVDTTREPTNPPESDKSDREDVLIDAQEEDTSPVQKKKDKDRELEKARLVEWASSLSLKDVVLTKDGLDVETLGVWRWLDLKCYVKQAFLQANKIAISQAHRKNNELGKNVANELNCKGFKHKIKNSLAKKQSPTTKPDFIRVDGTLYRMVNVIVKGKEQYIALKESHDKDDLDSRNPKATAWQILHSHYCSEDPSLLKFSPTAAEKLIRYTVEESILSEYDDLSVVEFKKVLLFVQALYKEACNKKTLSGFHGDFGACIGGRVYLLYLHHCLMEAGDKALLACAYPTLDANLKRGSMDTFKPLGRSSSTATDRSLSPMPDTNNFRTKKSSAVEATEQAAIAISTRESDRREIIQFDRMMEMKSMGELYTTKGNKLKRKFFEDSDNGESEESLKELHAQRKHLKKMAKHYVKKYDELKKELGYESPESSDDSLSL